ncbi:LCP family protein [Intrasporangium sp. YIM S08009]|uniref:LCP family protein n=1 Tax=Intrasporangium zincisolvens TaxID=3080018 RepID=UPI002B05821E|nr:LCP family protein [Intrasporangium sp. YIM S08009]
MAVDRDGTPTSGVASDSAPADVSARPRRPGLARALGLTLLGAALPGAGLTRTRRKAIGWGVLAVALATGGALAWAVLDLGLTRAVLDVVSRPSLLLVAVVVLSVGGVVWCATIVLTALEARPRHLDAPRTRALALTATVLVVIVAGGSFKGAEYALITRDTVNEVFAPSTPVVPPTDAGAPPPTVEQDPWASKQRLNVLLIGSDAASDRVGTRTDSMILASIDTRSGRTTLISLPRNLRNAPLAPESPLRQRYPSGRFGYPDRLCAQNGPGDSGQCMLTNLYQEAQQYAAAHPGAYPAGQLPGRVEIRGTVEQITGLHVDNLVVIDLRGFEQLVDAMGGIEVNVKNAGTGGLLPIGGEVVGGRIVGIKGYLTPGRQRLDGFHALWYARSRAADSDNYRQARQRCVVRAIVDQVDPARMLARYPELARIARNNIYTDIPVQSLPDFVDLAVRIQGSTVNSVSLTADAGVLDGNPDYALVRRLVKQGIAPPTPKPAPGTAAGSTGSGNPPSPEAVYAQC